MQLFRFVVMKILIGNKVKFINENIEGVVTEILAENKVKVLANDSFDYEVSLDEIIIINDDNTLNYTVNKELISNKIKSSNMSSNKGMSSNILTKYVTTTKYQYEKVIEVDLHLEELVEYPNKLEDWQKLYTQMQHVKKCLNAAFEQRIKKMVFIHGVGTGVLKIELRNFLSNYDDIIVKDADYREYGSGATEVILK